jgi:hypothetical protein
MMCGMYGVLMSEPKGNNYFESLDVNERAIKTDMKEIG